MSDAAAYTAGKRADFKLPTSSICQSSEQHHVSSPDICTQTDGMRCALAGLCTLQTAWIHADKHMRSNFSSPEFPGNFFKPASNLDPRARNKPERERRHGPMLKMESGYFCCATQHYAEESCQRYILFLLQGARQPHSIGALDARFISQYLNCMCEYFMCQLLFHWQLQQPQFIQHLQM